LHKHTHKKTAYHKDLITPTINSTGNRHKNKQINLTATLPGQYMECLAESLANVLLLLLASYQLILPFPYKIACQRHPT
jgi:hypothetical protein